MPGCALACRPSRYACRPSGYVSSLLWPPSLVVASGLVGVLGLVCGVAAGFQARLRRGEWNQRSTVHALSPLRQRAHRHAQTPARRIPTHNSPPTCSLTPDLKGTFLTSQVLKGTFVAPDVTKVPFSTGSVRERRERRVQDAQHPQRLIRDVLRPTDPRSPATRRRLAGLGPRLTHRAEGDFPYTSRTEGDFPRTRRHESPLQLGRPGESPEGSRGIRMALRQAVGAVTLAPRPPWSRGVGTYRRGLLLNQ